MNTRVPERLALENALRRSAERGEFYFHYQPIFDLASRRVVSAEALLRWRHPELGSVAPARFIPIAEDTGLITAIGEWVIRRISTDRTAVKEMPGMHFPIAVNLSAIQFRNRSLVDLLPQLIEGGMEQGWLELEITESVLMSESEATNGVLELLRKQGLKLVVDDFGTGYSNLAYLKRFDIYKLKIDQSFIRNITTEPDDAVLTRGIIGLARSLGLKVVAEGVETAAQLDFLVANGCDEVQGFLLCPPVGFAELIGFMNQGHDASRAWLTALNS